MSLSDSVIAEYKQGIEVMLPKYEAEYLDKKTKQDQIKTIAISYDKMYDGGIEKVTANIIRIWGSMGYRVVLYTTEEHSEKDYDYPQSVKRIVVPSADDMEERLRVVEKSFQDEGIDVYINNYWAVDWILWELRLMKKMQIPMVVYVHGNFSYVQGVLNRNRNFCHRIFSICDMVVCLDKASCDFYRIYGAKTKFINNPIPQELIERCAEVDNGASRSKHHKVLWIGRIAKGKRIEDAIKIIKEVKKTIPNITMDVVGDGPLTSTVKKIVDREGLNNTIFFKGYQKETEEFYKNCDVMLMTSEKEGYCFTILESKAYGKPCVMYDLSYLSLIQDKKGILLSPIGDIKKTADNLIELLSDENLCDEKSREARESYNSIVNFDIQKMWENIFDELCVTSGENTTLGYTGEQDIDINSLRTIINLILEEGDISFEEYCGTKEVVIGKKMLSIPRKIKSLVKK